jgi:predicted transposase/invertase (TIGR01784 family)
MAEEIHHPHDLMVHAVLSDVTEASSFLQAYLPGDVSQELNWSTLRLVESSFVDEALRGSEADLLYEVERVLSQDAVWLYILLEHQSTPDRWMRFRLLKYCCRIWDQSFRDQPEQRELRAIVPLVFYQGERRWTYSREFADLFAESVRDWSGVPRFAHELIDQSGMRPEEVQGELKGRLMQLVMLAAYHPTLAWMDQAARLLGSLASLAPGGGIDYGRLFVLYILSTQEPEAALSFREALQRHAPEVGDDLMTYAQELLNEGRTEGRAEGQAEGEIKAEVRIIENLLREGMAWDAIERVTGINEARFQALKRQVETMDT